MKNLLILVMVLVLVVPVIGEKKQKMDEKEMMKKWMEISTPGAKHKVLAEKVGKWETDSKMWMSPGAPPVDSKGSAVMKMILGGRYLEMKYKGSVSGMPFEGISISGYDNYKKKFVSTWIDTMGTGILVSEGNIDKTGKILTEIGDMDDFMTGTKGKFKTISIKIDNNSFKMQMYNINADGKEFKSMEIVYKRVK